MENTPAGGSSTNGHSSPYGQVRSQTGGPRWCWECAAGTRREKLGLQMQRGLGQGPRWSRPPVDCGELVLCPLLTLGSTTVLAQKQSPHRTACSLCPAALEPYGCGQEGLTDISPSGSPSAAREGSPCLVTLPHPVGGHRSWSPTVYSLHGGPGVLLSRKGASF